MSEGQIIAVCIAMFVAAGVARIFIREHGRIKQAQWDAAYWRARREWEDEERRAADPPATRGEG